MDNGSRKAFEYYRALIADEGYCPQCQEHTAATSFSHLLWMCEFALENEMDPMKYSRWLGYIQGCLICAGWTTSMEERNRTRPWFTDTVK